MVRFFVTLILMFGLTACGSSPKINFYTLNTIQSSENNSTRYLKQLKLGIWLVKLPAFLDRPEIVTRDGQYGIEAADFHRWAGGLDNNITRLIASELGQRLKTDHVIVSPWLPYQKLDNQIRIHIIRFDGEPGSEMVFSGTWSLLNAAGNKEILRQAFSYKTQTKTKKYNDTVAAFSQLTVKLSEQMASIIATQ